MVEKYRCSSCGYFHVGPAPEHCPVCGAPQTSFKEYDGPGDLSGTKTLDNLRAAFAGESQANRRYTLWRRIAELEGAPQSALDAFDRAAAEETAHALGHLAYMGGFGATLENLAASAQGEDNEATEMYPGFAEIAEAEGFPEIAHYFRRVGSYEGEHREEYRSAIAEIEEA
ncbi:MAG: rubrerythrin [Actinobacteria bacterium]|nr:MAG: rubrerythrin [Actinomycetota bacterium]